MLDNQMAIKNEHEINMNARRQIKFVLALSDKGQFNDEDQTMV